MQTSSSYVPALRFHSLTRFYDHLVSLFLREGKFREMTLDAIGDVANQRIVDLGCGTGSLTVRLKQRFPDADVVGVDIDSSVLALAAKKATNLDLDIHLHQSAISELSGVPEIKSGSVDCVVSSLVFHHLTRGQKEKALQEAFRVLKPHGRLILADWDRPKNPLMRLVFLVVQSLDGFSTTNDNVQGLIPRLIEQCGFRDVTEFGSLNSSLGTLSIHVASRPSD